MKAAVSHEYGPPDVMHIEEVPTPIPADDEVLIRVRAASVNLGDWELLTAHPLHLTVIALLFVRRPRHDVVSSSRPDASYSNVVTLPSASPDRKAANAWPKVNCANGGMHSRQAAARSTKRSPASARIGTIPQPTRVMPSRTLVQPTLLTA